MCIKKIPYDSHEEWLSIRHKYIGGSEAGTIVGLNKYSSPYKLWLEKTDQVKPFEGNTITEVGSYLEEFVAQQFTKITGKQVRRSNFTYVNDKYPFACANVDRLVVGEDAILEIKTTGNYEYMSCIRSGEPVPTWWCQITHYMEVLDKPKAYLAVLLDCREVRILEFDRDNAEGAALMKAEKEFWDMVSNHTPPEIDGAESTTEAIKTIYADSKEGTVDLTPLAISIAGYEAAKKAEAEAKEMVAKYQNEICDYMGNNDTGVYGSTKITWKTQSRKSFDSKAFEKDHPGMMAPYQSETTSRVFRYTKKKS